jgi:hypothetical protein
LAEVAWSPVHIAEVDISASVAAKTREKHGVEPYEVREADVLVVRARRHHDPERGWRLLVIGSTYAGRMLNVVLYPVVIADGTWRPGTAMPREGPPRVTGA